MPSNAVIYSPNCPRKTSKVRHMQSSAHIVVFAPEKIAIRQISDRLLIDSTQPLLALCAKQRFHHVITYYTTRISSLSRAKANFGCTRCAAAESSQDFCRCRARARFLAKKIYSYFGYIV